MKKIYILFGIMLLLTMTFASALPLSLSGETAGCSVQPTYVFHFYDGDRVDLNYDNALIEIWGIDSDGFGIYPPKTFFDNYYTYKLTVPHIRADVYTGCNYQTMDDGLGFANFGKCPEGYDKQDGECYPLEDTRVQNLAENCERSGNFWYDKTCNEEEPTIAKTIQEEVGNLKDNVVAVKQDVKSSIWTKIILIISGFTLLVFLLRKFTGLDIFKLLRGIF